MKIYTKTNFLSRIQSSLGALIVLSALTVPVSVFAEDESGIELDLNFVSNYVWRGEDYFVGKPAQENEVPGAHSGAIAFQPSLTFYTPLEGFYVNIWSSYALQDRGDVDANKDGFSGDADQANICTQTIDGAANPDYIAGAVCEQNGLRRRDEVDYTFGYEGESRIGTIGFGVLRYTFTHVKGSDRTDLTDTEFFFTYSPSGDIISGLYFNIYTGSATEYHQVGYGYDIGLTDDIELNLDVAAGYQTQANFSGWRDITGSAGVSIASFYASWNFANRVSSEFFDTDSNPEDFKVADPETGELEALPRTLWWISVGYVLEF